MNQALPQQLIVDIDDEIEALIAQINAAPDSERHGEFAASLQGIVIDSLLGPFGLSASMLEDVEGGNVTTLHNFEKGVTANDADRARHKAWERAQTERFDRSDYQRDLPGERKKAFQSGPVFDAYTGNELPKDGRAHIDHVVSAHAIEQSSKGHLAQTREQRVATANHEDNKVWTADRINCSKSDSDLMDWGTRPSAQDPSKSNAEFFGADEARLAQAYEQATSTVQRTQDRAVLKKQATEFLQQGGMEAGKLALRQMLGLCLADLARGAVQDLRVLIADGVQDAAQLATMLRNRLERTVERLKAKWADYLKDGAFAGLAGLFSSLATLLINSFVTTARSLVTIIREGTLALVRAVKTIVLPEPGTTGTDTALAVLKILSGAVVVVVGISLQEAIQKLIETTLPMLAPYSGEISMAVTGIATGIATLLAVTAFDRLKDHVAFRNKQLADAHRRQAVTLLKIKRTVVLLDQAHAYRAATTAALLGRIDEQQAEQRRLGDATDAALDDYAGSVAGLSQLLTRA